MFSTNSQQHWYTAHNNAIVLFMKLSRLENPGIHLYMYKLEPLTNVVNKRLTFTKNMLACFLGLLFEISFDFQNGFYFSTLIPKRTRTQGFFL